MNQPHHIETSGQPMDSMSEAQLLAMKNEIALFMHSWVRDIAASRLQNRKNAAVELLEYIKESVTGTPNYPTDFDAAFAAYTARKTISQ